MLWQWVQGKVEDAQDVYSFCADHVIVECAKKTKLTVLRWRNHRDETSFKFHCRKML